MDSLERLVRLFREFPGIGPRQARRFAYALLERTDDFPDRLVGEIAKLRGSATRCADCSRFFPRGPAGRKTCDICADRGRDQTLLMTVCRDVDLETVEHSSSYTGRYFVLGGTVPLLAEEPEKRVRLRELSALVDRLPALAEIIIATNMTPEGEHTADVIERSLAAIASKRNIARSRLGRGLSTGAELEYSDAETIAEALRGRRVNKTTPKS